MLRENFEAALKRDFNNRHPSSVETIDKYERDARRVIKPTGDQNKGQVARYVARQLARSHPGFVPGFVEQVAVLAREAIGATPLATGPLSKEN